MGQFSECNLWCSILPIIDSGWLRPYLQIGQWWQAAPIIFLYNPVFFSGMDTSHYFSVRSYLKMIFVLFVAKYSSMQ